ncbi:hybrid sensor histidine kinase/response regulator [Geopsychrobacter electrodiphilus]|uniref:hybrid sensor histidine kinase/response regulator n=1 Tax=Geopsychrobacter electrodiphilus TaxID=225196 RepID=UPI000377ED14|nr:response regulator [Geopsychrobacter electrodiphilus]
MGVLQDSIFSCFVEEATEHLNVLESGLLEMEGVGSVGAEDMESLFRAAHTLKGAASLVKMASVGQVAHRMEDLFEAVRDRKLVVSPMQIDALLFALDQIKELIRFKVDGQEEPVEVMDLVIRRLDAAEKGAEPSVGGSSLPGEKLGANDSSVDSGFVGSERRGLGRRVEESAAGIRVSVDKIESLMGLIGEVTVIKNHLADQFGQVEKMRDEIEFVGQRLLREVTQFADRYDYTMPTTAEQRHESQVSDFQELEFDRYDDLNLFSRKLREITNDVGEGLRGLSEFFEAFGKDVSSLDRMTDEIKERISEVRTVPAGALFQRFNRSVRDMARGLGMDVDLFVVGGETLIDRVVYDGLFDPLLHIVRNSFAHGIESASERKKLGKSEKALIRLTAERRGNTVELSVSDDGRGIDLVRVRKRAIEKGFITTEDRLSESELIQMIFRPGFSTTVDVDATSGRGVGMNVVMDRLASLNGTIDVETVKGQGSTFRLRLPLSLVIVNIIRFEVAGQVFVLPSALVKEIQNLSFESRNIVNREDLERQPEQIDLRTLFNLPQGEDRPGYGILTQSEGSPILLLVDRVLGQEDTVIKPFGSFLRGLPYLSGTSLAGDGSMRLVVNPARMRYQADRDFALPVGSVSSVVEQRNLKVLVVDDSLSVRKYASMLLAGKGLTILTAADGLEAVSLLENEEVDSIITDLEMPHMHGYELLAELQRRPDWQVPIAVLSSRAGEQHRQKALSLGATDYLVKPFEEEQLMAVIKKHLAINGKSL